MSSISILYGQNHGEERASLAESPLWDDHRQCWFWIDIPKRRIHRHSEAEHRIWQLPEHADCDPGSIAVAMDGRLWVALRAGIASIDPEQNSGSISPEISIPAPYDTSTTRFNDGGVDALGRWWIGTLFAPKTRQAAGLYCLEKGKLHAVLGEQNPQEPWHNWGVTTGNGWGVSPDGKTLYQSDTQAHTVYQYDYSADQKPTAALNHRRVFFQTEDTRQNPEVAYQGRSDGAVVDAAGNYWTALFEGGQFVQIAPNGQTLQKIALPAKCPTMMCLGDADLKTLIITTTGDRPANELLAYPDSGMILKIKVETPGLATRRYQP